jgi:hypothetical protein
MAEVVETALERMMSEYDFPPPGLVKEGRLWVLPSDGKPVPTVEAINDLIDRIRNGEEDD